MKKLIVVDGSTNLAAGDAFNAGFAAAPSRGFRPDEAASFAAAVAALSFTRRGALPSLSSPSALKAFRTEQSEIEPEITL